MLQGKSRPPFYINQIFSKSFKAHDIRLNVDGDIAQIDHIAMNKYGAVFLFETKNFSNDVKIDEDGIFNFYDSRKKDFRPFPSPIEQSKRHERVLRKAFEQIGFIPIAVEHFVIFDYKAKISKPKTGFDNVCYPDMLEKAHEKFVNSIDVVGAFKGLGNLALRTIKSDSLAVEESLQVLIDRFHQPAEIDYRAKFGIYFEEEAKGAEPVQEVFASESQEAKEKEFTMLTLAKAAKQIGMKTKELEDILVNDGFMSRNENGFVTVTDKGKQNGIQWRKGRGGYYFLIPKDQLPKVS